VFKRKTIDDDAAETIVCDVEVAADSAVEVAPYDVAKLTAVLEASAVPFCVTIVGTDVVALITTAWITVACALDDASAVTGTEETRVALAILSEIVFAVAVAFCVTTTGAEDDAVIMALCAILLCAVVEATAVAGDETDVATLPETALAVASAFCTTVTGVDVETMLAC
jgi:hypothetical protein